MYREDASNTEHCPDCGFCIEGLDHHCPWINNCVGVNNHNSFLVFIVTLLTVLLLIIASSIAMLTDECNPKENIN